MNIRYFFTLTFCMAVASIDAQSDTTIWRAVRRVEDNRYIITIPESWKKVSLADAALIEGKYELTGIGIPPSVNTSPLVAYFTIGRIPGNNIPKAVNEITSEFNSFSDKVLEPNAGFDSTKMIIHSGEGALMLHTRFYRRSKVSNYSKYYLVVYSPKADATFTLLIHFQYKDPLFTIERSAAFRDYATRVFTRFALR